MVSHKPRWLPPTAVIRTLHVYGQGGIADRRLSLWESGTQPSCNYVRSLGKLFPANLAKVLELWQTLVVPLPSHLQMSTPLERLQETPDSCLGEMTRTVPVGEHGARSEEAKPFPLDVLRLGPQQAQQTARGLHCGCTFPHGCDADARDS